METNTPGGMVNVLWSTMRTLYEVNEEVFAMRKAERGKSKWLSHPRD